MKHTFSIVILFSHLAKCATTISSNSQCQSLSHRPLHLPTCATYTSPSWDPTWSFAPVCFPGPSRSYCAHTLSSYRGKRGASIISTSDAAHRVVEARDHAATTPFPPAQDLYDVRAIPQKGHGVIAKTKIPKGQVIMLDAPAIIASAALPMHIAPSSGAALFQHAVNMLDQDTRNQILALDGSTDAGGLDGVMHKNAFSCRFDDGAGDDYLCLFPAVSRINHACRPNANAKFSLRTLMMEIRALRDIAPGEEVSISYGRVELGRAARRKLYRENWGFECTCEVCMAGGEEGARSDGRRERFGELREWLVELTAETYDAQRVIAWEREVFEISEEQGFEVLVADDMERMAYVHAGLGNRLEALSWAQRARDNLLQWKIGLGDSSDDLSRVVELVSQLSTQ